MKINVQIDAGTPEGQQIIDYLKTFPDVVTFEAATLNESQQEYITQLKSSPVIPANYVSAEEFRVEAKKRAKALLKEHGLYS
ncbi:hypothetical protein [Proteiniphilum sp. UBA5384]|uniref:hypothetical protein n=1 Tax=Proteiniphilum sp. UBA5384 TaxID=1947279 RepID=UPI0025ECA139|nr:hypothetical protein [Proteiniphilum sp. UBA5384]